MSTDDSGIYNVRKVREQSEKQRIAIPVTWAVLVTVVGIAVNYGINSQRQADFQQRLDQQSIDIRQLQSNVAAHDTKLEVDRVQYAEIIRRLDDLNAKIEHQQR